MGCTESRPLDGSSHLMRKVKRAIGSDKKVALIVTRDIDRDRFECIVTHSVSGISVVTEIFTVTNNGIEWEFVRRARFAGDVVDCKHYMLSANDEHIYFPLFGIAFDNRLWLNPATERVKKALNRLSSQQFNQFFAFVPLPARIRLSWALSLTCYRTGVGISSGVFVADVVERIVNSILLGLPLTIGQVLQAAQDIPGQRVISRESKVDEDAWSIDSQQQKSNVPDEFLCPITLCIMRDPVLTCDGSIFERKAIEEYFGHHFQQQREMGFYQQVRMPRSPLTNVILQHCTLVPDEELQKQIKEYLFIHNMLKPAPKVN